jgi:hypothetical protein
MRTRLPPRFSPQSGIRPTQSPDCLRCACILTGIGDPATLEHPAGCLYRMLGRDPTRSELFANLTPPSPA